MAQFVQAGVGYRNPSVRPKRLQATRWGNHLLSPGNFRLFGQHSDLSPGYFLLVHANCLNVNTDIRRWFCPFTTDKIIIYRISIKGIVHQKWNCAENVTNVALHLAHQGIPCSEWVPSERDQTADKTSQYSINTSVLQLMSCELKSCVFVENKSIKNFRSLSFWLKCCFWSKYAIFL